jgi:hypothetical protein
LASPIGPRHAKCYLDYHLHQRHVLEVQEVEPSAKGVRLVLALYAESELSMKRPESGFETAQRFVGIEEAARRQIFGSRVRAQSRFCRRHFCYLPSLFKAPGRFRAIS